MEEKIREAEKIRKALAAVYSSLVWIEEGMKELKKSYWLSEEKKREKKKLLEQKLQENYKIMEELRNRLAQLEF